MIVIPENKETGQISFTINSIIYQTHPQSGTPGKQHPLQTVIIFIVELSQQNANPQFAVRIKATPTEFSGVS